MGIDKINQMKFAHLALLGLVSADYVCDTSKNTVDCYEKAATENYYAYGNDYCEDWGSAVICNYGAEDMVYYGMAPSTPTTGLSSRCTTTPTATSTCTTWTTTVPTTTGRPSAQATGCTPISRSTPSHGCSTSMASTSLSSSSTTTTSSPTSG